MSLLVRRERRYAYSKGHHTKIRSFHFILVIFEVEMLRGPVRYGQAALKQIVQGPCHRDHSLNMEARLQVGFLMKNQWMQTEVL